MTNPEGVSVSSWRRLLRGINVLTIVVAAAFAMLPTHLSAQPGEGEKLYRDKQIEREEIAKQQKRRAEELAALAAELQRKEAEATAASPLKLADEPAAVALKDLTLFETEPKKYWFFTTNPKGEIGKIPKNEVVRIVETKYIDTLFERSVWLRVVRESSNQGTPPLNGWVYAGKSQGDQFVIPVAEKR